MLTVVTSTMPHISALILHNGAICNLTQMFTVLILNFSKITVVKNIICVITVEFIISATFLNWIIHHYFAKRRDIIKN